MSDPAFWSSVHAALVHFPIASTLIALACDVLALALWPRPVTAGLLATSRYTLAAGAIVGLPAAAAGLVLTRGELTGHAALRAHHLFAWPALGLLVGLATWKWVRPAEPSRAAHLGVVGVLLVLGGLIAATGHAGGQLTQLAP